MGNQNKLKSFLILCACLLLIPILGISVSTLVESKYESIFVKVVTEQWHVSAEKLAANDISFVSVCRGDDPELKNKELCSYVHEIQMLRIVSLYTILLGFALIALIYIAKLVAGESRSRLAVVFSPLTVIALIILSISVLIQGAILTYSVWIAESVYLERVHIFLIIGFGLSALMVSYLLIKAVFSALHRKPLFVVGEKITPINGGKLIEFVRNIATKINARMPENIVIGMEPSFYITAASVQIDSNEKPLNGTTMYLSLPFLSILSRAELQAVIGHELGHFKGNDTVYSMRFYPAYAGIANAITSFQGYNSIFIMPPIATLSFIYNEFSVVEKTIRRGESWRQIKLEPLWVMEYILFLHF